MGDFWSIAQVAKAFDDNKGISQVLTNTEKGKDIFDKISNSIDSIEANIEDSLQHNLKIPTPINPKSKRFWDDYMSGGFEYIIRGYHPRYVLTKRFLRAIGLFERVTKIKHKYLE